MDIRNSSVCSSYVALGYGERVREKSKRCYCTQGEKAVRREAIGDACKGTGACTRLLSSKFCALDVRAYISRLTSMIPNTGSESRAHHEGKWSEGRENTYW